MDLFDELAADAQKDIDSGKFLQENGTDVDGSVMKSVEDMEKKMQETLNKAVEKINNVADAAAAKNVPDEVNENNTENEGVNEND